MPRSRRHAGARLGRQARELSLAVPQVIAHRLNRMAASGPLPSRQDQREFTRMGTEKVEAFQQSWVAMTSQAWRMQQEATAALWQASWTGWSPWVPWSVGTGAAAVDGAWLSHHWMTLLSAGLEPLHARAVANARRLGGPRR